MLGMQMQQEFKFFSIAILSEAFLGICQLMEIFYSVFLVFL